MIEETKTKFGEILSLTWGRAFVQVMRFDCEGSDHTHDQWEHAVCLDGPCQIIIDGVCNEAPLDGEFSIPPNTPHRMRPTTAAPSTWLIWYSRRA